MLPMNFKIKKIILNCSQKNERIYTLTARINNCLHSEFGIKNLYHRMIFTACALVAKRFQAPLTAGMDYETFKTCIKSTLKRELKDSQKENQKIELLWQVNDEIKMNSTENQEAIDNFIKWVSEISDCLNSKNLKLAVFLKVDEKIYHLNVISHPHYTK